MNWAKVAIGGVVGGIALWLTDFVLHGLILGNTYMKYEVFTQEQASVFSFLLNSLMIAFFAAILFAKTRIIWNAGAVGGGAFGFWLGMVAFWTPFYSPLVFEGFPYYLAWCQGGSALIGSVVLGAVLGVLIKRPGAD